MTIRFQALKLEKISKLETLTAFGVMLQFFADLLIGREFSKIQYIAISGLFLVYIVMGLEAFFKSKFEKPQGRLNTVHADPGK